jgi:hypothetical protein
VGGPQLLPSPLGQGAQDRLRFLPRRDPGPDGRRQRLGHVVARGTAVRAAEAHIEVGPVLTAVLAAATRAPAGAMGLRERAKDEAGGQRLESPQEGWP